jgi:hypothetical protein
MPSIAMDREKFMAILDVSSSSHKTMSSSFSETVAINAQVAAIMQEILQKNEQSNGFFYPDQYYYLIKKCSRRDYLQERGDFFHGYLPHKLFFHTDRSDLKSPTGKITEFKIQKGILPSVAMDAVMNQLALVDCCNMCQIAQYQAIRKAIGDEKFNLLFEGRLLIGDYKNKDHPLHHFLLPCHDGDDPQIALYKKLGLTITDPTLGKRDLRNELDYIPVGARVFFTNVDRYLSKHLIGSSASFNVIYAGDNRYFAFGISTESVTADKIKDTLINAFNASATNGEHLNNQAKIWYGENRARFSSFKDDSIVNFEKEGGGFQPLSGKILNEKLIAEISQMDLKKLSWEWVTSYLSACVSG